MRQSSVALLFLALLLAPLAARAEDACGPKPAYGKPVVLATPLNEHDRLGLGYAALMALSPPDRDWPRSSFAAGAACLAGAFKVGDAAWTLHRGSGPAPAMWARPADGPAMAFLALAPSIEDGFTYSQTDPHPADFQIRKPGYMLVVVRQRRWFVVQLYDGYPPADRVIVDMTAGLKGEAPLIASFDPDGVAISFAVSTQSDRHAMLADPRPGEGGNPARLWTPDGELFRVAPGVGLKMAGSGFVCPTRSGDFPLTDLWVANVTEARRDLSCRYIGQTSWISIFVTRRAEHPPLKGIYDGYVDEVRGQHTLTGPAPPPLAAGPPQKPPYAGAWTSQDGTGEGLWVAAVGDWYVEVRATYAPADSDKVGLAVGELFASVYRTLPAPTT